ncbi:MAG: hypothetical protein JXQ90_14060 [Cyclobacteriaceae bacterium]
MSPALEIIIMLLGALAIGVIFTKLYWKKKLTDQVSSFEEEKSTLLAQLNKKETEIDLLKKDLADSKAQNEKAKKPAAKKESGVDKKKLAQLEEELDQKMELLEEREREIEVLSQELANQKISYYKQIDGKRYKAVTLKMADEAVAGKGDGRISKEDAEKIFATISDGKSYTQVEKDTMRYLRDQYNWTEGADALFRTKVRSWAARHHELN